MTDWDVPVGLGPGGGPPLASVTTARPLGLHADPPVLACAAGGGFVLLGADPRVRRVLRMPLDPLGGVSGAPSPLPLDLPHGVARTPDGLLVTGLRAGHPTAVLAGPEGVTEWAAPVPHSSRPFPLVPAADADTALVAWADGHQVRLNAITSSSGAVAWPAIEFDAPVNALSMVMAPPWLPEQAGPEGGEHGVPARVVLALAVGRPARLELVVAGRAGVVARARVPETEPIGPQVALAGDALVLLWGVPGGHEAWALCLDGRLTVTAGPARVLVPDPPARLQAPRLIAGDGHLAVGARLLAGPRHRVNLRQAVAALDHRDLAAGEPRWLASPGGAYDGGAWLGGRLLALHGTPHPQVSVFDLTG